MSTQSPYVTEPGLTASTQELDAAERATNFKRISWGAVFSGVVLTIGIQLLLSMLGTGIGLSTIDPRQGDTPALGTIGISAGIWWTLSNLIALFAGGWIAGYLAGIPRRLDGVIHGALTWSLSTILALAVVGTALGSLIAGTMQTLAPQVADVARQAGVDVGSMQQQARQIWDRNTGGAGANSSLSQQDMNALMDRLFEGDNAGTTNRQEVIETLVDRGGMNRDAAERMVTQWTDLHNRLTGPKARAAADEAASAMSKASLWGFVVLFLGAIAAVLGGMAGIPRKRSAYARPAGTPPPTSARRVDPTRSSL